MTVALEIRKGSLLGRARIEAGRRVRLGGGAEADFVIPGDPGLAPVHFALQCGERTARLVELSPRGITINGAPFAGVGAEIRHGDWIGVGSTSVQVSIIPEPPPDRPPNVALSLWEAPSESAAPAELGRYFSSYPEPIFAVIDAARSQDALRFVRDAEPHALSLYTGNHEGRLADFAPYLLPLSGQAELLERCLREGWGKSWGFWITSRHEPERILAQLRRMLIVEDPRGRTLYFRFYDPNILRTFLPTCSEEQADLFFDSARSVLMEAGSPRMILRYTRAFSGR